jgi:hypothetical protein
MNVRSELGEAVAIFLSSFLFLKKIDLFWFLAKLDIFIFLFFCFLASVGQANNCTHRERKKFA